MVEDWAVQIPWWPIALLAVLLSAVVAMKLWGRPSR